jgi:hypothetical protein
MSKFPHCERIRRLSLQGGRGYIPAARNPLHAQETGKTMKMIPLALLAVLTMSAAASAAPPSQHSVSLTQDPLIMRLNKDEFRIAFGINAERCGTNGCSGMIRYRVDWKTADGTTRSEIKQVGYSVSPLAHRTIAVDRQYFDTAEGRHTTDVVKVSVDAITCRDGADERKVDVAQL